MADFNRKLQTVWIDATAISPNDTVDLARPCQAVYVGVSTSAIAFVPLGRQYEATGTSSTATLTALAVPAGILPIAMKRVCSTGTTATGLIALY